MSRKYQYKPPWIYTKHIGINRCWTNGAVHDCEPASRLRPCFTFTFIRYSCAWMHIATLFVRFIGMVNLECYSPPILQYSYQNKLNSFSIYPSSFDISWNHVWHYMYQPYSCTKVTIKLITGVQHCFILVDWKTWFATLWLEGGGAVIITDYVWWR